MAENVGGKNVKKFPRQNELCVRHGCNKKSNMYNFFPFAFGLFVPLFSHFARFGSVFYSFYVPSGVVSGTRILPFTVLAVCVSILYGCFICLVRQSGADCASGARPAASEEEKRWPETQPKTCE